MDELERWLTSVGLDQLAPLLRANDIDRELLSELTEADLEKIGLSLGHRKKLLKAAAHLKPAIASSLPEVSSPGGTAASVERRHLTVMFYDLVSSTTLATQHDPEDVRDVLGAFHRRIGEAVSRFAGFIARIVGDGALVYFGYPQAHEDDAERAVRAGLAAVVAMSELTLPDGRAAQIRVGIATGMVVVGDIVGTSPTPEEDVAGEAPNLAARLQALAEPGGIVISAATQRLLGDLFEYQDLGLVNAKGFPRPVKAWQVLGESGTEGRFEAMRRAVASIPLVGREDELDLLLRRWQRAKSGEGQVVLLSAEAGVGKSRLVAALYERLQTSGHTSLRYYCSLHHQDSPLIPIIRQLERAAGFQRDDAPDAKLRKLEELLGAEQSSRADLPLFADLLALPSAADGQAAALSPAARKRHTLEALVRRLERLAQRNALLIVFEDTHWIDPTSLELLQAVVAQVPALPALLVVTFRPEFAPPWVGQPDVTSLMLSRLPAREAASLVAHVAGAQRLPGDVVQRIVERTDGVPLFVEELTKAVLEARAIDETNSDSDIGASPQPMPSIPATLHASLMARLDRLGTKAKEVAQIGAAIGREFSFEVLAGSATLSESELREALDQLVASGLVLQRGEPPQASYLYKHILIRDAAYGTLIRERRRHWHARIAAALQEQLPDFASQHPELVAHHLAEAGLSVEAGKLWEAAGNRALARAAHREAAVLFERALAMLSKQNETPDTLAAIIDLRRRLHQAIYPLGELHRARGNMAEAQRIAEQLGDSIRVARVLASQTYLLAATGDLAGAIAAGERALSHLTDQDDLEATLNARLMLARSLYAAGRYDDAIHRAREVVALVGEDVERGAVPGANQTVSARAWLAICHAELGSFEAGAAEGELAMRLASQSRCSEHDVVWSRVSLGRLQVVSGECKAAIETLAPALPLCKDELAIYFSRVASTLGSAYAAVGQLEKGLALLRQADEQVGRISFTFGHALVLAQLGAALLLAGDAERAQEVGLRAVETAQRWGELGNEAWALCLLGDVSATRQALPEARAHYQEALAIAEKLGMAPVRAQSSAGLNRLA